MKGVLPYRRWAIEWHGEWIAELRDFEAADLNRPGSPHPDGMFMTCDVLDALVDAVELVEDLEEDHPACEDIVIPPWLENFHLSGPGECRIAIPSTFRYGRLTVDAPLRASEKALMLAELERRRAEEQAAEVARLEQLEAERAAVEDAERMRKAHLMAEAVARIVTADRKALEEKARQKAAKKKASTYVSPYVPEDERRRLAKEDDYRKWYDGLPGQARMGMVL